VDDVFLNRKEKERERERDREREKQRKVKRKRKKKRKSLLKVFCLNDAINTADGTLHFFNFSTRPLETPNPGSKGDHGELRT
jgi:hypothetical protein